jgi:hypothetical protein
VTTLIGRGIAEQVFAQLEKGGKRTSGQPAGEDDMPGQSTLSRFG